MGFHFPLSLHEMTETERKVLDEHILLLKEKTKSIYNSSYDEMHVCTVKDITRVNSLLKKYSAIIFGDIMGSFGKVKPILSKQNCFSSANTNTEFTDSTEEDSSPIIKMLRDDLAPIVYSMQLNFHPSGYYRQMQQYKSVKYSSLGEGFVTLIGSYMTSITNISSNTNLSSLEVHDLVIHGVTLLNTLNAWMAQEIHLIPDTVSYVHKKAEKESRRKVSQNAVAKKNEPNQEFKEKAANVAKKLWEDGSELRHNKMVNFLMNYIDDNGIKPFACLPNKSSSANVLRETVKEVAIKLNRRDLITGLKKL